MTKLIDGPAHGKRLMLRRAARFLRVVVADSGEIDALDQPTDKPKPSETCYAYEIVARPGNMHIRCGGRSKGASGFYPVADYKYMEPPLEQEIMRDAKLWAAWTQAEEAARPRPELYTHAP